MLEKSIKKIKFNKIVIFLLIGLLWILIALKIFFVLLNSKIFIKQNIVIDSWGTISTFIDKLDPIDSFFLKVYINTNSFDFKELKQWVYVFSWNYSKQEIVYTFLNWPLRYYEHITLLESWSKFDIDEYLVSKWYISTWEYIKYVDNSENLMSFRNKFEFLDLAWQSVWQLTTLEGFLYPDTYYIDMSKPFIQQLVMMQLEAFQDKIWKSHKNDLIQFQEKKLDIHWFKKELSLYELIILASIVENEEKLNKNKAIVAWILLNKLDMEWWVYADVTVCYWLAISYKKCNPNIIAANIQDKSNTYNTRQNLGLPPTPISSPSLSTIKSLINLKKTSYMFYLHDQNWQLYPSKTYWEHNLKKSKYLNR